jgi:hypothetical protein
MAYLLTALATGDAGAVKLEVRFASEPTVQERYALRAEASGSYRRLYSQWCEHTRIINVAPIKRGA